VRKGWRGTKTGQADDDDDDKRSEIKDRMIKLESDVEGKKNQRLRNAEVKENNIKNLKINRKKLCNNKILQLKTV